MPNKIFSLTERIKQKGLFLSALIFLFAAQTGFTEDCHKTASTQTDMNLCAHEEAEKANAGLNEVFKKLMAKVSPAGQPKLRLAKEAWTVYRALQCEFNTFGSSTGSAHPIAISECYADMTRDYIKVLREQLDCVEGDLSCSKQ